MKMPDRSYRKVYSLWMIIFLSFVSHHQAYATSPFNLLTEKLSRCNPTDSLAVLLSKAEQASLQSEMIPANPELDFDYLWPSSSGKPSRWSIGLSQELPDFVRRHSGNEVVHALRESVVAEAIVSRMESSYEAKTYLLRFIGAKKELRLLNTLRQNLDSLAALYERAWDKGEVTILDLNKIRIEQARATSATLMAEGNVSGLESEILELAKGSFSKDDLEQLDDYPILPPMGIAHDELAGYVRQSIYYRAMEARLRVASKRIDLASKVRRVPQFKVGYLHSYEDGTHFNGLSVGMTLPVYSRRLDKSIAIAEFASQELSDERKLAEILGQVESDYAKMKALESQLEILSPAVENTNNKRLLRMALDGGELSLLDYLQELSFFVDAEREYNASRLEYSLLRSSVARYLGQD